LVDAWAEKEKKKHFDPNADYEELDLSQFHTIEKDVCTGDLYIFNGQFLHTVTDYKGKNFLNYCLLHFLMNFLIRYSEPKSTRLGISMFIGWLSDDCVIYWQ